MTDEKDLEIARLQGEVAALGRKQDGAITATLKVVGTLLGLAAGGAILLTIIGNALPEQTAAERDAAIKQEAEKIVAKCEADYAGFPESTVNDCKVRAAVAASERF